MSGSTHPPAGEPPSAAPTSPGRLRAGVLLVAIWWLPVWLLAPALTVALNWCGAATSVGVVTTVVVVIQTVLGLGGAWLAGSQVMAVIKRVPRKRVLKALWSVLVRGRMDLAGGETEDP